MVNMAPAMCGNFNSVCAVYSARVVYSTYNIHMYTFLPTYIHTCESGIFNKVHSELAGLRRALESPAHASDADLLCLELPQLTLERRGEQQVRLARG